MLGHTFKDLDDAQKDIARIAVQSYHTRRAIWSIYETVSDMKSVAVKGEGLQLSYTSHWGPAPITIALPNNPTWLDLLQAADYAITLTGDHHHVFIEHFELTNSTTISMTTGS